MPEGTKYTLRGRPRRATRAEVEATALRLLHRRGFNEVSVEELAAVGGISRATWFRYFGAKAGVVWWRFDEAIDALERELGATRAGADIFDHIERAILSSIRAVVDNDGIWWDRFVLLDTEPALQGDAASRWARWTHAVESTLAGHDDGGSDVPTSTIVASAYQGAYVGVLRGLSPSDRHPDRLQARMRTALAWVSDLARARRQE